MAAHPCRETTEQGGNWQQMVLRGPSTEQTVDAITRRVMDRLRAIPMPEKNRFEIQLALVEGLDNAIGHGNGKNPHKNVTVTCHTRPHQVTLTIEDEGNGFDPSSVPDPTAEENLLREGGRGIFLIQSVADECRFESSGARMVLVFRV